MLCYNSSQFGCDLQVFVKKRNPLMLVAVELVLNLLHQSLLEPIQTTVTRRVKGRTSVLEIVHHLLLSLLYYRFYLFD